MDKPNDPNIIPTTIKCVTVGDGAVGKTCMLVSYATNSFPTEHVPTVFDNHSVKIMVEDILYDVSLFDTAGQEEFDKLRILTYPGTDIFLVCFSIMRPESFSNVEQKWIPELQKNAKGKPFILVGTKEDLREDPKAVADLNKKNKRPITQQQGARLAKKYGALFYLECSALTQNGLSNVFTEAVKAVQGPQTPTKTLCFPRFVCMAKK